MTTFNFTQIISSKLIHDFASLSGIIENSAQMLIEGEDEDFAKQMLQSTSKKLVDRIKFYRFCFSKKNQNHAIKTNDLIEITKNYFEGSKVSINLNVLKENLSAEILHINAGFIANALSIFASLIAQNGLIEIEVNNGEIILFSKANNILNNEINQALKTNVKEINEHNIHYNFFYQYAKNYNLKFFLEERMGLKLTLQLA